jgi:flagellar hook-associated protein 3 FlgL
VNITQQIADNDDTDMPKSIMQLKLEENVYRSALGVGARIIPPSLLDFLS